MRGTIPLLCVLALLSSACTSGGALFLGQPNAEDLAKFNRFVEGIPPPSTAEVQKVGEGEVYCRVGEYSGVTMSETATVCFGWDGGKWARVAIHLASGAGFFPGVGTAAVGAAIIGTLLGPFRAVDKTSNVGGSTKVCTTTTGAIGAGSTITTCQ